MKLSRVLSIFLIIYIFYCDQIKSLQAAGMFPAVGEPADYQDDGVESDPEDDPAAVAPAPALDKELELCTKKFVRLSLNDRLEAIPLWVNHDKKPDCLSDLKTSADVVKVLGPFTGQWLVITIHADHRRYPPAAPTVQRGAMVPASTRSEPKLRVVATAVLPDRPRFAQFQLLPKQAPFHRVLVPNTKFILLMCATQNRVMIDMQDEQGWSLLRFSIERAYKIGVHNLLKAECLICSDDVARARQLAVIEATHEPGLDRSLDIRNWVVEAVRHQMLQFIRPCAMK